jgi:hemerythrin-like metal-binding protein
MGLFTWQNIYSVGVEQIDNQHKKLFEIANRFHAAFLDRANRTTLAGIFNELIDYTAYHFADEERLMRDHNYPDYERHKANHDKLVSLVMTYKRQLDANEPDVEQRAMDFVKTWLNGHILGMDRNYRDCLKPQTAT